MKMASRKSRIIMEEEHNIDLLVAILHRLPLRYLLPCKSVNKQFLTLISEPFFFHPRLTHHQLSPNNAFEVQTQFILFRFVSGSDYQIKTLFSIDSNNKTHMLKGSHFLPRSLPQDRDRVRVKATHHDLVLCSTHDHSHTHYFVTNPFTKQYVALPPLRRSHAQELARVGFMCDESRSRFCVMHIPIVCFQYVRSFQVNMFSSETGKWSSSDVIVPCEPNRPILMSNSCSKNILVYKGKFIWWIKYYGFVVCDPFNNPWYPGCQIIDIHNPCSTFDEDGKYDIYNGICNGRVRICVFTKENLEFIVYELVSSEELKWSTHVYCLKGVITDNMNLLGFHPHCEFIMYLYSKNGIFMCDYKNKKVECVYTAMDEDEGIRAWGNVMSLLLPEWPTPVPTLNAAKL